MERQAAHELLIKILEEHPSFNGSKGGSRLSKKANLITADELKGLDSNDTNTAVHLFLTALNIYSGSVSGSHNYYELLEAYSSIPECRSAIDEIASKALNKRHAETSN